MKNKFLSRKFILALAAFLGSIGTMVVGLYAGNEKAVLIGNICSVVSVGLYAFAEAYVDANHKDDAEG